MAGISLKEALAIAARYTDPRDTARGLNTVVLRDGCVRSTNLTSGCEVPCPAVEGIDLAVDCAALRKMVSAIGEGVKLSTLKGRKLSIKGPGVKYTLQSITQATEPTFPAVPEGSWSPVSAKQLEALTAVATMVDVNSNHIYFQGLRLTPKWCAASTSAQLAFAWIDGLVSEGFTCPPAVFADITGDASITIDNDRLYLKSPKTGQVHWSLGLDAPFPDESIEGALVDARGRDRTVAEIKLGDFALLCKQAGVVSDSKVYAFRLELGEGKLALTGHHGAADFNGAIELGGPADGEDRAPVGMDVARLEALSGVILAAGGEGYCIAVSGPLSPVMLWNHGEGAVIVETLCMPMRLE